MLAVKNCQCFFVFLCHGMAPHFDTVSLPQGLRVGCPLPDKLLLLLLYITCLMACRRLKTFIFGSMWRCHEFVMHNIALCFRI